MKYLFGRMGERTYWRSVVGLPGSTETPFAVCGHEFQLELVGIVDVALRIRSSEWKFLTRDRCSEKLTSYSEGENIKMKETKPTHVCFATICNAEGVENDMLWILILGFRLNFPSKGSFFAFGYLRCAWFCKPAAKCCDFLLLRS